MTQLTSINVGGQAFDLFCATGTVTDAKKWSSTHVSGGGDGNAVRSSTTTHDQIFIREPDGEEHVVELSNEHVRAREGNRASLVWAKCRGHEKGPYVAFINHDTGSLNVFHTSVYQLYATSSLSSLLAALLYLGGFLGFFMAAGAMIWNIRGGAPPLIEEPLFLPGVVLLVLAPIVWFRRSGRERRFIRTFVANLSAECKTIDGSSATAATVAMG